MFREALYEQRVMEFMHASFVRCVVEDLLDVRCDVYQPSIRVGGVERSVLAFVRWCGVVGCDLRWSC